MKDILDKWGLIPKRPEVFDSSMLKTYMDCPSKFYLRYVLGLVRDRPDHTESAKFDWGTCWHEVLEAYYSSGKDPVAALAALNEGYPEYITPSTDKYKRSKQRMIEAFFGYLDVRRAMEQEYDILRNEQFFDVFDEKLGLRWSGRIDSIRRRKHTGKIRIWDYKTSSAMGEHYFTSHELGFQFPGYVWAGDILIPGEDVEEISIDVMYMISKSHDYHFRTFRYDAFRKREWVNNVKRVIDSMNAMLDDHLYEPEAWVKNWNECTRYGPCTFLGVHNTTPRDDTRLRSLSNEFKIARWDPRGQTESED